MKSSIAVRRRFPTTLSSVSHLRDVPYPLQALPSLMVLGTEPLEVLRASLEFPQLPWHPCGVRRYVKQSGRIRCCYRCCSSCCCYCRFPDSIDTSAPEHCHPVQVFRHKLRGHFLPLFITVHLFVLSRFARLIPALPLSDDWVGFRQHEGWPADKGSKQLRVPITRKVPVWELTVETR